MRALAGLLLLAAASSDDDLVRTLAPPPSWTAGPSVPANATAGEHEAALRADPLHGDAFVVQRLEGPPSSRRVVFLIPQFHRSVDAPIAWTSLGAEIAAVQARIDALVTRLVAAHGVRCVGTEGSSLDRVRRSDDLVEAARWRADLDRLRDAALRALGRDAGRARGHLDAVIAALDPELRRHLLLQDGVGLALARTSGRVDVERIGLEDPALNREALRLHHALVDVERALARDDPEQQTPVGDAMTRMFLDELPDYERRVLRPLDDGLAALDRLRTALRRAGDEGTAEVLGRFVSHARLVQGRVVDPDGVAAYAAYARAVQAPPAPSDGGVEPPPRARLSKEERARLEEQRRLLREKVADVRGRARDEKAAERLLARLPAEGGCALVFGQAHKAGLVRALRARGGPDLAVLVVAPYLFEDG